MTFFFNEITLTTQQSIQIIDLTALIQDLLSKNGIVTGMVTILSSHTTAFVTINEWEDGLRQDMVNFLSRIAPAGEDYYHNKDTVDDRKNAHAHLTGLLLPGSVTIPISQEKLLLGTWQSVLFIEMDGPREGRRVNLQFWG